MCTNHSGYGYLWTTGSGGTIARRTAPVTYPYRRAAAGRLLGADGGRRGDAEGSGQRKWALMDAEAALSARVRRIAADLLSDGSARDEPDAILAALWVIAAADRLLPAGCGSRPPG